MGCIKTILSALVLSTTSIPMGHSVLSDVPVHFDALNFFAVCAGRLSAEMEFYWIFDGATAERIEVERASVLEILDAMISPNQVSEVLSLRVEAKMAQAALLTQANFNPKQRMARHARTLALKNVESCRTRLLS